MSSILPSKRDRADLVSIADAVVTLSVSTVEYTGGPITPMANVSVGGVVLRPGDDYEMTYSDNVGAGTASVKITGVGKYTGTVSKEFTIARSDHDVSNAEIAADVTALSYTGSPRYPYVIEVTIGSTTLVRGVDYDVEFSNNVEASSRAVVTVTGKGDYFGKKSAYYTIAKQDVSGFTVTLNSDRFVFNGQPVYPEPTVTTTMVVLGKSQTVTLVKGTAYDVSYSNNFATGTGTVTIVGKGLYGGTKSVTFVIGYSITDASVTGLPESVSESAPTADGIVVTDAGGTALTAGTHYAVTYEFFTEGGSRKCLLTVVGKGTYSGFRTFTVNATE